MKQEENNEIDFFNIFTKLSQILKKIQNLCLHLFLIIKTNKLMVLFLILIGISSGFYFDSYKKEYIQNILVSSNFNSTNYLYEKIDLIESKIKEKDKCFLKKIGIKHPEKIKKIQIKPINLLFQFIENRPNNFELIKLMAENSKIDNVIEKEMLYKNYKFHKILIFSKKVTRKEFINPIIKHLNKNEFFDKIKKEKIKQFEEKIIYNEAIIAQINKIINTFINNFNNKNNSFISYNENTELNEILKTKQQLIKENDSIKIKLIESNQIIKPISIYENKLNNTKIYEKMKFIFPVLLIFFFLIKNYKSKS